MSLPSAVRSNWRPTHEYTPQGQFYPELVAEVPPQTLTDAYYYFADGHDIDVMAQHDSYMGRPDIQEDILWNAANAYMESLQPVKSDDSREKLIKTVFVSCSEPLVFYWHRQNNTKAIVENTTNQPKLYAEAVTKALTSLSLHQVSQYQEAILRTAAAAGVEYGTKVIEALQLRQKQLGVTALSTVERTFTSLDLKNVA